MYGFLFYSFPLIIITLILSSCTSFDTKHLSNEGTLPTTEAVLTPSSTVQNWLTYENANFSIAYPENWEPARAFDYDPRVPTRVWVFRGPVEEKQDEIYGVDIGVRADKIAADESLMQWSIRRALHSQATTEFPGDFEISVEKEGEVGGQEAVFGAGRSPLTEFQYTNVRCGEMIWFIWTNIGTSAPTHAEEIYDNMVSSFRLVCDK